MAADKRLVLGVVQADGSIRAADDDQQATAESTLQRCASNEKRLRALDVSNMAFTSLFVTELASVMRHNTELQELYLNNCRLGDEGVRVLAQGLARNEDRILRALSLDGNDLHCRGASHLAKLIDTQATRYTRTFGGYCAPARGHCNGLRYISLKSNAIAATGAKALAEVLMRSNDSLRTLHMQRNRVCDWGAGWFAMALRNNSELRCLNLCENPIGSDGMEELRSACLAANASLVQEQPGIELDSVVADDDSCLAAVYVSQVIEVSSSIDVRAEEREPLPGSGQVAGAFKRSGSASRRQACGTQHRPSVLPASVTADATFTGSSRASRPSSANGVHKRCPCPMPGLTLNAKAPVTLPSTFAVNDVPCANSKSSTSLLRDRPGERSIAVEEKEAATMLVPPSRWRWKPGAATECAMGRRNRGRVAQGCGVTAVRGLRRSASAPGRRRGMLLGPHAAVGLCG